ncbi:AI-2E family transporter [Flavobacterium sp. N3904]|uniref:AI-2E family transporter n=1 Tax=Flavobacterium sp. N3904 TaxID=2986835 RepID=UPI0022253CFD|nr:AI-2E family transporter [Flavobacterium sp. N3904]
MKDIENIESKDVISSVYNFDKIVDLIIRIGVLFLLLGWCFDILKPFISILIWAIVIAVAIYPIHCVFVKIFRGKRTLAIIVLTMIMLAFIVIPSFLVTYSLYDGIVYIRDLYKTGQPLIPSPDHIADGWPPITKPIVDIWRSASENFQEFTIKYSDNVKSVGAWILQFLGGVGRGIIELNVSIIVAGVLLGYSDSASQISKKVFIKLAGKNGDHFADVSVSTIRNVVKGFLGVALIQSALAGIGFFVAGVPFAGLWTVLCLVLAIVQIGVGPIAIPVAIYMFSVLDATSATILAVWLGFVLLSDNILKPILLGKSSSDTPMLVVFLGAVGGLLYDGFVGLFLGAVILTIGYKLFITWVNSEN